MTLRRVVAIAVLLAVPVWVFGQTVTQDGSRTDPGRRGTGQGMAVGGILRSDTTFKMLTFDGDGNLLTQEATPAYEDFRDGSTAIIDDTTAVGMADSSVVINMGKYRLHALALKIAPGAGAATPFSRIAISVRFHLAAESDSASVFPIPLRRPVVAAGTADSLTLWARTNVPPTSVAFSDREVVVVIQRDDLAAAKWSSGPGTVYLPIADQWGQPLWAPYISVRVRQIGGSGVMNQKVYLVGTPQ